MPRRRREALSGAAIRQSACLSVRLSVPPGLGAQRLGQATRAVRTARERRFAAIGGGVVSPRDNLLTTALATAIGRVRPPVCFYSVF